VPQQGPLRDAQPGLPNAKSPQRTTAGGRTAGQRGDRGGGAPGSRRLRGHVWARARSPTRAPRQHRATGTRASDRRWRQRAGHGGRSHRHHGRRTYRRQSVDRVEGRYGRTRSLDAGVRVRGGGPEAGGTAREGHPRGGRFPSARNLRRQSHPQCPTAPVSLPVYV
jgi:hypothetical protein